jgi:hypothetical protein
MSFNRYVQGLVGLLVVVLIFFVGFKARNEMEQYNYIGKIVHDRDTITIQGNGKVTAKPDIALINLGVTTEGVSVKDIQTKNTNKMNAIIAALKAMDITSKDIQTSNYSIYSRYDWKDGRQMILGYTVSQDIAVKIRNLDSIGDVLAKAGELGMNQTGGVSFTIDEPEALREDARAKAIEDAKKKAEQLASKLGLHIVKVVTFTEGFQGNGFPMATPMLKTMSDGGRGGEAVPSPDIQSGSLDVVSDVSVTFEVR